MINYVHGYRNQFNGYTHEYIIDHLNDTASRDCCPRISYNMNIEMTRAMRLFFRHSGRVKCPSSYFPEKGIWDNMTENWLET